MQHTMRAPKVAVEKNMQARLLKGFDVAPTDDFLESRVPPFGKQ